MAKHFAITININPKSFISAPVDGKLKSLAWQKHTNSTQRHILKLYLHYLSKYDVLDEDIDYSFEQCKSGIEHMHLSVQASKQQIDSAKKDFCLHIEKRMPDYIMNRCVLVKEQFHPDGWDKYVHKNDVSDDVAGDVSDDVEPDVLAKLRKKLFV